MAKYPTIKPKEGGWTEWIRPVMDSPYKFQCCDCGLVHNLELAIDQNDGLPIFRVQRNNRATGQVRRHRGRE